MSKEKVKTSLEEAFFEIDTILEAATNRAKDKIAKEMPDKFENFLSEELNKNNNKESVKESIVDKNKKEPVVGNKKTDNKKESLKEMEQKDMREMSMQEVEDAYNSANLDDEFEIEEEIDIKDIAEELDNHEEEENLNLEMPVEEAANDPYSKLKKVYGMMSEMLKEMETETNDTELKSKFEEGMSSVYGENFKEKLGEDKLTELLEIFKETSKNNDPQEEKALNMSETKQIETPTVSKGDDEELNLDDLNLDDINPEKEVDEGHGQSYSVGRQKSGGLPNTGAEYRDRDGHSRNLQPESVNKRVASLINENKKATKKLQTTSKQLQESINTNKKYKEVLEKYRGQLQEMAVVNTNIAHVNDVLIVESDIPSERVKTIINKFKDINSITESEKTYKKVISEMKEKKNKLDENIEKKISDTLGESSSKKITEQVVEKTAYGDKHLDEIKKRMNYMLSK